MKLGRVLVSGLMVVTIPHGQSKEFVLGKSVAANLEQRDGKIADPQFIAYLQSVAHRIAAAAGASPLEIHATRGEKEYAQSLAGAFYISAAMLRRVQNEAELAGLIAHEIAHRGDFVAQQSSGATIPLMTAACVMASPMAGGNRRESEQDATRTAIDLLKKAGYDPLPLLEFLSKLAYDHPEWSRAISPDDLMALRAPLELEHAAAEYHLDSSEFHDQYNRVFPSPPKLASPRLPPA